MIAVSIIMSIVGIVGIVVGSKMLSRRSAHAPRALLLAERRETAYQVSIDRDGEVALGRLVPMPIPGEPMRRS